MTGGAGNDTYVVEGTDTITEAAAGGIDTVRTAAASATLAVNVENLVFTGTGASPAPATRATTSSPAATATTR